MARRFTHKGTAELAVIGDNVPHEGLEPFVCNVDKLVLLVPSNHRSASERRRRSTRCSITTS
jgi:hypothetical protein